jgi:hypothetical protein
LEQDTSDIMLVENFRCTEKVDRDAQINRLVGFRRKGAIGYEAKGMAGVPGSLALSGVFRNGG